LDTALPIYSISMVMVVTRRVLARLTLAHSQESLRAFALHRAIEGSDNATRSNFLAALH